MVKVARHSDVPSDLVADSKTRLTSDNCTFGIEARIFRSISSRYNKVTGHAKFQVRQFSGLAISSGGGGGEEERRRSGGKGDSPPTIKLVPAVSFLVLQRPLDCSCYKPKGRTRKKAKFCTAPQMIPRSEMIPKLDRCK